MLTVYTKTAEETMTFGEQLGAKLGPGDVVALFGGLGAGKTTLTKGIARGAGVEAEVFSPTFTLIHEHPGRVPFYHVDLYRLTGDEDVEYLGLEEYLYGDGVVIIEWADRAPSLLPKERIEITLGFEDDKTLMSGVLRTPDESCHQRRIQIHSTSERLMKIVESVVTNDRACD